MGNRMPITIASAVIMTGTARAHECRPRGAAMRPHRRFSLSFFRVAKLITNTPVRGSGPRPSDATLGKAVIRTAVVDQPLGSAGYPNVRLPDC